MSQKTFLVTGGAGFIGSNLCRRLLDSGNKVICLDNFVTGTRDNLAPFLNNPDFRLLQHDITMPINIQADAIFNLACPASPPQYQNDPVFTIRTCVYGTMNMLDLAIRHWIPILQASTSEIYGDPLVHPQVESYWGNVNPIGPRSCYDEGKRCAETLFCDYHRQYKLAIKIVRIFNTYGPNMDPSDGRVVSNFIVQALKNQDITLFGDGEQTRSFCYVDDLIDALIRMMDSPETFTGPVNVGNPDEFTIRQLAELIIELTGTKSKIIFRNLPQDDPVRRKPDISLAQQHLDWTPSVKLRDGLIQTIEYFKQRIIGE